MHETYTDVLCSLQTLICQFHFFAPVEVFNTSGYRESILDYFVDGQVISVKILYMYPAYIAFINLQHIHQSNRFYVCILFHLFIHLPLVGRKHPHQQKMLFFIGVHV